jgi:hypothetical protein
VIFERSNNLLIGNPKSPGRKDFQEQSNGIEKIGIGGKNNSG